MISKEELLKVAKLSRLKISGDKVNYMHSQLSNIMEMINQLQLVNTDDVEPLSSVCGNNLTMRKDEVSSSDIRDDLFKNVPGEKADFAREIGCYIVPKVVE